MNRVSCGSRSSSRLGEGRAVHVGDEAERKRLVAEGVQRTVGHLRPKVRAADSDVDDIADALAAVALPGAGADLVREGGHAVEHGVHLGDDVLAVDDDRLASRGAERHMQDGPVLAHVDLLAGEHGVTLRLEVLRARERREQPDGLVVDAVLRIVEKEPGRIEGEAFGAPGIGGEKVAQPLVLHAPVVGLERLPPRRGRQHRLDRHRFHSLMRKPQNP